MKRAFVGGIILDGTENMIPQSGKAVITENGIITDIIPEINVPAGVEKINLCGEYILPGLINLHVHFAGSGNPTTCREVAAAVAALHRDV